MKELENIHVLGPKIYSFEIDFSGSFIPPSTEFLQGSDLVSGSLLETVKITSIIY